MVSRDASTSKNTLHQCYTCDSAIDGAESCTADDSSPATGDLKDCPAEESHGCYIVEGCNAFWKENTSNNYHTTLGRVIFFSVKYVNETFKVIFQ